MFGGAALSRCHHLFECPLAIGLHRQDARGFNPRLVSHPSSQCGVVIGPPKMLGSFIQPTDSPWGNKAGFG